MSQLLGMDVTEVRELAAFMKTNGTGLLTIRDRLTTAVGVSTWKGRDADQFVQQWNGVLRQQLTEAGNALLAVQETLLRNADHQQATSDTLDGPATGASVNGPGGSPLGLIGDAWLQGIGVLKDGAAWVGDRIDDAGEWVDSWVDDRLENGPEWARTVWDGFTSRVAAGWDGLQRFGSDAFDFLTYSKTFWAENGRPPRPMELAASALLMVGSGVGTVWNVVTGEDHHLFDDGRPLVGEPYVEAGDGFTPPMDFRSLTANTMNAYEQGTDPGVVRMHAIRNEGEPTRYVFAIPGTQAEFLSPSGWGGTSAANDWFADLLLMADGQTSYTQGVQEAMDKMIAADRAAHPGETGTPEILLTGHSQGGMVAAYIAADPEWAAQYNIAGVINYAGPIDNADIPSDIPVLSLKNGSPFGATGLLGDPIPTLDGGGRPDVLDLVFGTNVEQVTMNPRGLFSHGQDNYLANVNDALSPNPSFLGTGPGAQIRGWEEAYDLDRFYAEDPGSATQYHVKVERDVG